MKHSKRKKWNLSVKAVLPVLAVLAAIFSYTLVLALMTKKTPKIENEIHLAEVTCKIHEKVNGKTTEETSSEVTGITVKNSVTVENTGNIDAYIRVRLVSYYVNEDGDPIGESCEVPAFVANSAYWAADTANDTYYYKTAIAPGVQTENLVASGSTIALTSKTVGAETVYQVVEVLAEAVQSEPDDAVSAVWNVTVSNGSISK